MSNSGPTNGRPHPAANSERFWLCIGPLSLLGSARESDEVPNWRGFHGFGSPAEVGRFCDCGLTAANRPTGCRSRKLARLSHPPRGMGIAGASPEIFHPMKVDKLFPRWRAPFEGPRLLPLAETCGGGPEQGATRVSTAVRALGRTATATVALAFQGSLESL